MELVVGPAGSLRSADRGAGSNPVCALERRMASAIPLNHAPHTCQGCPEGAGRAHTGEPPKTRASAALRKLGHALTRDADKARTFRVRGATGRAWSEPLRRFEKMPQ